MSFKYEVDPKVRVRRKFYDKLRRTLTDVESDPIQNDTTAVVLKQNQKCKEIVKGQDIFGEISRDEIDLVLQAYDRQQADPKLANNAVKCDSIRGGSYAKLLFSKPGFHNPGSTKELVDDLKLRDVNRESFLGGYSTFVASNENSLESITNKQRKLYIREEARRIYGLIVKRQNEDSVGDALHNIASMDHKNGDVLAVIGRWALRCKEYEKAISQFELALENGCWDANLVAADIADACCKLSLQFYSKDDFVSAINYLTKALSLSNYSIPQESADYARNLMNTCQEKLAVQRRMFGTVNTFSTRRK